MTNVTTFESLENTFGLAEEVLINMKELSVNPEFQMREKMDHSVIDDYVEVLDKLPPIHVFEIEVATGTKLILTDGFHRFFAHERAESETIRAKVIKGSREEAMKYAMTANFTHLRGGSKPSAGDQKKAINKLCEVLAEDFGYSSKNVVKMLQEAGVTANASWMRKCTQSVRDEIDEERDAAILRLTEEGKTQREIASEIGCAQMTVSNVVRGQAEQKRSKSENVQDAPEESTFEFEPFPEEDDSSPVINPAEAESKVLQQFDEELAESNAESANDTTSPSSASVVISTDSSISNETVMLQVEDAFQHLIDAWETHGKEGFDTFLKSEREAFLSLAGGVGMSLK